ncbi:MAG: hypothetical protein Ta2D_08820 [Rickettsiales bacterium]|nr:MAG: hypothetical protein Ta2D_08820 [Rickettsiales bacterium]
MKINKLLLIIFLLNIDFIYAKQLSNINDYKDINNIYGKWKVIGYKYYKTSSPGFGGCKDDKENEKKYTAIQNKNIEQVLKNEVGKIITIEKDLYEYPYNKDIPSNYFVYNDKDLGNTAKISGKNFGGKRDYEFYNDGKCIMSTYIFCHKVDNPIYEVIVEKTNLYRYDYIEKDIQEIVSLFMSRMPEKYELPLDNDNEYVLEDSITIIQKKDNTIEVYKSFHGGKDRLILEKLE